MVRVVWGGRGGKEGRKDREERAWRKMKTEEEENMRGYSNELMMKGEDEHGQAGWG